MALLAKAAAPTATGRRTSADFTQIYTPAGFATARGVGHGLDPGAAAAPVRLHGAGEEDLHLRRRRRTLPSRRRTSQLTIRKLSPDEQAQLPIVFLERPEELATRYAIQRSTLRAPSCSSPAPRSDLAWLKLAVSADGCGREGLSYEDTAGNRTEFRFEGWKTEKPRPAEDYRVVGPKGTRIVED